MSENNSFRKNPKNEDSNTNTIHIYSTDKEITPQEQFHQSRTNNYSHVPNSSNDINKEESCFTKNKTLFITKKNACLRKHFFISSNRHRYIF